MSMVMEHLPKNGTMKLTMDRHTIGARGPGGAGMGLTGVQYSLYLHVTLIKFCEVGNSVLTQCLPFS